MFLSDASAMKSCVSTLKRQRTKSTLVTKLSEKGHSLQVKVHSKASALY